MIWKPVRGFLGLEASEDGDLRKDGEILRRYPRVRRYPGVFVGGKLRLSHRLVAIAFHGEPPFPRAEAMHLDGDPVNNRASNLRWGTHAENMAMDRGNNHSHAGLANPDRKIDDDAVLEIRRIYDGRTGHKWGRRALARKHGLSEEHVHRIATRREGGWLNIEC